MTRDSESTRGIASIYTGGGRWTDRVSKSDRVSDSPPPFEHSDVADGNKSSERQRCIYVSVKGKSTSLADE